MLGERAVGKTSLVARFVRSIFSEKYLSTIGVKIDRKAVQVDGEPVNLILWDIEGETQFRKVRDSYLRGSSGFFLVADGTRPDTIGTAVDLVERLRADQMSGPVVLAINKSDLEEEWATDSDMLEALTKIGCHTFVTSAKNGSGVDPAFTWHPSMRGIRLRGQQ